MKPKTLFILSLVLSLSLLTACGEEKDPDWKYYEGYDAGYEEGYSDGYNKGYAEGYNHAYDIGLDDGYEQGYAAAKAGK